MHCYLLSKESSVNLKIIFKDMMAENLSRNVFWAQIFSFVYILFLLTYNSYTFSYLEESMIGIFTNLLTVPIVLGVVPCVLGYTIYEVLFLKKMNTLTVVSFVLAILSIGIIVFWATVYR